MSDKLAEQVAFRINELRHRSGLTLQQLAHRMDAHYATVHKLENGDRKISLEWLERIANALDVQPMELLAPSFFFEESVKAIPVVGKIAAGNWQEAVQDPSGHIYSQAGGPNAFALRPEGDSMDLVVSPGGYIVVDPDDFELRDGKLYAIMNAEGETTFKRYRAEPARLEPASSNPMHQPISLGRGNFSVVGRVVAQGSDL